MNSLIFMLGVAVLVCVVARVLSEACGPKKE